jgi:NAD(P)-dependent dehydrogenase (short-subunit alcohol dehydrogenase family)
VKEIEGGSRAEPPVRVGEDINGNWTPKDIPDLSGRVAIVTGANSGMGLEIARELARKNASVVLACRDNDRGSAASGSIRSGIPEARVKVAPLDLASLASVRRFADVFRGRHDRLDVLVNNAGVLLAPYGTTEDGFELHFGINHLGHFALTGLLMDRLLATRASRIVTVSSRGHATGRIDFANLTGEDDRRYSAARAYGRSKLANLLFTYELHRRLAGTDTTAVAAHPGGAATDLGRRMGDRRFYRAILPVLEWLSQSAAEGARPILRAATDPDAEGGEYYGPGGFLGMRGRPVVVRSHRRSYDEDVARRLWAVSEELTGVRYL